MLEEFDSSINGQKLAVICAIIFGSKECSQLGEKLFIDKLVTASQIVMSIYCTAGPPQCCQPSKIKSSRFNPLTVYDGYSRKNKSGQECV